MIKLSLIGVIASGLTACKKTPDGVLGQEEMASLMADMHMGEAVIDYNYSTFPNDSTRKVLKQSILVSHGVTQEDVDTSFVWYGNHIEDYIKVYDRTIEIIQDRQRDFASASNAQISIAGDSVEVWNGPRHVVATRSIPMRYITFNIEPDSTWQNGDVYMLSFKPLGTQQSVDGKLLVDYTDGSTKYTDNTLTERNKRVLRMQVDSTLTPLRVYGYISLPETGNSVYEIDSIALTRMRKNITGRTYYSQTSFNNGLSDDVLKKNNTDSISVPNDNDSNISTLQPQVKNRMHRSEADNRKALPEASSKSHNTEHRQTATQHKVDRNTNAATKLRNNQRQQTLTRREAVNRQQAPE